MKIIHSVKQMREFAQKSRLEKKRIGFVPTMGALHEGHLSLMRESRKLCNLSVISIFVNRLQFNDPADFSSYPQSFERDCEAAQNAGVDCVFAPDEKELYRNHLTYVTMKRLGDHLCGASRPGHFDGVFTVVSKLFNIVGPDTAFFGQKDIQQARCIEKMCEDLNFPVTIKLMPIVRDTDGLAMSSRNVRLSADERLRALALYMSLRKVETMIGDGITQRDALVNASREILTQSNARIDYVELVDYDMLEPVHEIIPGVRYVFAIAAFYAHTRLIDNMIITPDGCRYRETMNL